jgi:hypothetical protein
MYLGTIHKKEGKLREIKTLKPGGTSASFSCRDVLVTLPALEVTGTSTRRKVMTGGTITTLGRGLRGVTAGSTSDHVSREVSLACPLLFPLRPKTRGGYMRLAHDGGPLDADRPI